MLVSSGLGSYSSRTVVAGDDGKLIRVLACDRGAGGGAGRSARVRW